MAPLSLYLQRPAMPYPLHGNVLQQSRPDMTSRDVLAKPAYLLTEVQRQTHALPVRLRILNMLTYELDMVYMHDLPGLIEEARFDATAATRIRTVTAVSIQMLNDAVGTLRSDILPALEQRGLLLRSVGECLPEDRAWLHKVFAERVRPLLTPLAVDAGRPFPQISAHSLNLLAVVRKQSNFDVDMPSFARLKVPRRVPRLLEIGAWASPHWAPRGTTNGTGAHPRPHGARTFVLSEEIVRAHVEELFPGVEVEGVYQFRILRGILPNGSDIMSRHSALARQKAWPVVRLDVEPDMPAFVLRWLLENMAATEAIVLRRESPLGIGSLASDWADRVVLP